MGVDSYEVVSDLGLLGYDEVNFLTRFLNNRSSVLLEAIDCSEMVGVNL